MPYQIVFEWDDNDFYQDGIQKLSRLPTPDVLAEKSEMALRAAMLTIQDVGERVATTMDHMSHPPESATIEFGIRLGADAGVITKGDRSAHFSVKLVWHNNGSSEAEAE